jgi:hypothetical protein
MEMPQGNSLCSYLKQTKMTFFFCYKTGEQEDRTGPVWGLVPVGGRMWAKGVEGNMVQTLCICICKWETIPGTGEGGTKNDGRD